MQIPPGSARPFEPRRDVDALAQNVAVRLGDHVAEIDADAKPDAPVGIEIGVAVEHAALHLGGTAHRIDDAGEFRQQPIAGGLDDTALMLTDFRVDQLAAMRLEAIEGALLVHPDEARIPRHIGGQDRGKSAGRSHRQDSLPLSSG